MYNYYKTKAEQADTKLQNVRNETVYKKAKLRQKKEITEQFQINQEQEGLGKRFLNKL